MGNDVTKRLDAFIKEARKQMGNEVVVRFSEGALEKPKVVSTGALNLDVALGIGGIPLGRVTEIYGNEGSGKTTLALHVAAEAMKKGMPVLYIDAENALDPSYAQAIGMDTESDLFILSQPDDAETALQLAEKFAATVGEGVIIVDSVAALVTRQELQGDIGDSTVAVLARLLSASLRRLVRLLAQNQTALIFINQIREKVGVMYGNPETTPGGRALKFYSSIRLEVRRQSQIKKGTDVIGHEVKVKVVKNKLYPPYKEAVLRIIYGQGIDKLYSLLEAALALEVITRHGSYYDFGEERLAQGKESLLRVIASDEKLQEEIRNAALKKVAEMLGNTEEQKEEN